MKEKRDILHRLISLTWDIELCELRLGYINARIKIVEGTELEDAERKEVNRLKADLEDYKGQFNRVKKTL